MTDETLRPRRPETNETFTPPEIFPPASPGIQQPLSDMSVQPPQITGNIPPQFASIFNKQQPAPKTDFKQMSSHGEQKFTPPTRFSNNETGGSSHLQELLQGLRQSSAVFEEIQLPSKGKFYDGKNGPSNGVISVRPMTGEEEQILATPRLVKKGQALNMIFQRCLREGYRVEELLTIDRTYLLIYLRGISYTPAYDVELKCPECDTKFGTTIDLNALEVEECPDDYGPELQDVLPTTQLPFSYRLATGADEKEISDYRDRKIKNYGDTSTDDSLIYRTSHLLNHIDGISDKRELQILLKNLPINDVSYIRNCVNDPPFGVDTKIEIICPSCLQDFEVDLPLETGFFFPRRKKTKTQA